MTELYNILTVVVIGFLFFGCIAMLILDAFDW